MAENERNVEAEITELSLDSVEHRVSLYPITVQKPFHKWETPYGNNLLAYFWILWFEDIWKPIVQKSFERNPKIVQIGSKTFRNHHGHVQIENRVTFLTQHGRIIHSHKRKYIFEINRRFNFKFQISNSFLNNYIFKLHIALLRCSYQSLDRTVYANSLKKQFKEIHMQLKYTFVSISERYNRRLRHIYCIFPHITCIFTRLILPANAWTSTIQQPHFLEANIEVTKRGYRKCYIKRNQIINLQ